VRARKRGGVTREEKISSRARPTGSKSSEALRAKGYGNKRAAYTVIGWGGKGEGGNCENPMSGASNKTRMKIERRSRSSKKIIRKDGKRNQTGSTGKRNVNRGGSFFSRFKKKHSCSNATT